MTDRASFANFDKPENCFNLKLILILVEIEFLIWKFVYQTAFVVFGVDGLLQCGDVAECQEEEDNEISLVPYRSHLKQQP